MKTSSGERIRKAPKDRIEGNTIILDSRGEFPKKIIIFEPGGQKEYEIKKTRKGRYLLN
jgi:hypothetical protein